MTFPAFRKPVVREGIVRVVVGDLEPDREAAGQIGGRL